MAAMVLRANDSFVKGFLESIVENSKERAAENRERRRIADEKRAEREQAMLDSIKMNKMRRSGSFDYGVEVTNETYDAVQDWLKNRR